MFYQPSHNEQCTTGRMWKYVRVHGTVPEPFLNCDKVSLVNCRVLNGFYDFTWINSWLMVKHLVYYCTATILLYDVCVVFLLPCVVDCCFIYC